MSIVTEVRARNKALVDEIEKLDSFICSYFKVSKAQGSESVVDRAIRLIKELPDSNTKTFLGFTEKTAEGKVPQPTALKGEKIKKN